MKIIGTISALVIIVLSVSIRKVIGVLEMLINVNGIGVYGGNSGGQGCERAKTYN